jgi:CDP-diacylglycerol--serine O-phosphatidyltransferase
VAALALLVTLAFLMVSTLRYRSFKKLDLRSRQSYLIVLGIALALILIAIHPKSVLLALASLYWLSGPTSYVLGLGRRRAEPPVPGGEATSELPRSA